MLITVEHAMEEHFSNGGKLQFHLSTVMHKVNVEMGLAL